MRATYGHGRRFRLRETPAGRNGILRPRRLPYRRSISFRRREQNWRHLYQMPLSNVRLALTIGGRHRMALKAAPALRAINAARRCAYAVSVLFGITCRWALCLRFTVPAFLTLPARATCLALPRNITSSALTHIFAQPSSFSLIVFVTSRRASGKTRTAPQGRNGLLCGRNG